jgi:hypothetical protein
MEVDSSNKKSNNMWKNKLEDTSELSFATLQNKEAAWDKLQDRLEKAPRKRSTIWYWVAAACILLIATVPFISTHKTNVVVQSTNNIKPSENITTKQDRSEQKMMNETAMIHQPKKEKQHDHFIKAVVKKEAVTDPSTQAEVVNNNIADTASTAINTISTPANDTNTVNATAGAIKKKLRVVHINELGEPVEVSETATHNTDLHLFQLKLAQQEIYNTSSTAASSDNGSFLFKSKKPSN